jgi:outer membrane protein TolC
MPRSAVVLVALALALPLSTFAAEPEASPAAVKRYTFAEAIERALARSPSALTAQQEILRTEALVREVRASSLPTLTGNVVATRLDADRVLSGKVIQGANSLAANALISLPLVATQRWMQWVHARDQAQVSRVSEKDVQRSLAITAARAYLLVIAARRTLEVNERAFRTAGAHYDFAHGRYSGGVGNRLDEVRARQQMETIRSALELTRSALARAQEALGVVLAEEEPVDASEDPPLAAPPSLDDALKDAAHRRTDVRLQKERLAAAQQVVKDSWADFMPSITGTFQPFYQEPPTLTSPQTGWQAQAVLVVPFYDGGLRYGQQHEREALKSEADIALAAVLRQVQSDVRAAYEQLKRADASLDGAQSASRLAREVLELASQAYAAGATTTLEVIDAERQARDAESAAAVAEDGARQARLDVLAATGRFP